MSGAGTLFVRAWRKVGAARGRHSRGPRRPLRLREPFFSPPRESRLALARHDALVSGGRVELGDWETHTPVLAELLTMQPSARVLELGVGYGSTPLVLALSSSSVSLETDAGWFRRFARYASSEHEVLLWEDFTDVEWTCPYLEQEWDVALVDNAPAHSRQSNLEKLASGTRFIVCHDTEECFRSSPSDYRWDFSMFRHVWTYTQFGTYTTVISNVEPISLGRLAGTNGLPHD